MTAEVIDLISSPEASAASQARPQSPPIEPDLDLLAGALSDDVLDLSGDSPYIGASKGSGTVSNAPAVPKAQTQEVAKKNAFSNDFLFLSDDFDSTDNFGSSAPKRRRLSPASEASKNDEIPILPKVAEVAGGSRTPLQAAGLRRWNSALDPIQFSSSPLDASQAHGKSPRPARRVSPDPFRSSPKVRTRAKSPLDRHPVNLSSDPFASPFPAVVQARPAEEMSELPKSGSPSRQFLNGQCSDQRQRPSEWIDLSSDPFDVPSRKRPVNNTKKKADWDPISSSIPEVSVVQNLTADKAPIARDPSRSIIHLDNDSIHSDSDDLPDLADIDFSKMKPKSHSYDLAPVRGSVSRSKSSAAKTTRKMPTKTAEEKQREKSQRDKAKEAEKEQKRLDRERIKERKAVEKEREKALAEVNKLRTDKKVSTAEMIVHLPATLRPGVKLQIEELLGDLSVQIQVSNPPVDNVIGWRRKVNARYNEELGHWEPAPLRIEKENHVLVLVEAGEFVKIVLGLAENGQDLDEHVSKVKANFPNHQVIYLIEGLTAWMRKNRNIRNRQFVSAVRDTETGEENMGPPPSGQQQSTRRGKKKQAAEYVDEELVEDALLSLQVVHGTLIHHTAAAVETAQWVSVFTQHISTIPYRHARDVAAADAGFCMESGQVRTGEGTQDTYIRMLQEVARITAPIAYGIAAEFPSVTQLVAGLERRGPLALENCRKCANKDGAFTDRTIGQAVSKRVYKIFTGTDPSSTEV